MGLFDFGTNKIYQSCLYMREDDVVEKNRLQILDRFIRRQHGNRKQSWPFIPSLKLPFKFNGKELGEVYLISERTGEPIDLFNKLPAEWKGDKLWGKIVVLANEEHHKVISKRHETVMDKATIPLAYGVGIFVVLLGFGILIQLMRSQYGG